MPLSVIGAGLGRTGTMSLKLALEQLGKGPCYHMVEVLLDPMARAPGWIRAADGDPDWEAVFAGYTSTVDYPGCTFWRELAAAYPQAKVVLSVRDPDDWFDSTQATVFSARNRARLAGAPPPIPEFFEKVVRKDLGEQIDDRAFMTTAFRRHIEEVRRTIPAERLLVFEVAQGWAPLCNFLGVPVPDKPFPRVNTREEIGRMMAANPSPEDGVPMDVEQMRERIQQRLREMRGED